MPLSLTTTHEQLSGSGQLNMDIIRHVFEQFLTGAKAIDDTTIGTADAHELYKFALVSSDWAIEAKRILWQDLSLGLANDGFFVPRILSTLSSQPGLASCVRTLHVLNTLEGALWQSDMRNEGDVFAALVRCCPLLADVVVPSFEVASRGNVLDALSSARQMRRFTIRCLMSTVALRSRSIKDSVYIESARRSQRFSTLIPYFDWNLETLTVLFASWPLLESVVVRHCPTNAYHMKPDIVLAPRPRLLGTLPSLNSNLTRLELRETFIDDAGLFHLVANKRLIELVIMSCQGITSSAITKQGLRHVINSQGCSLKRLEIMTPWLPTEGGPKLVLDEALQSCTALESLTVAGWDVSDAFFACLPACVRLRHLGITDFEAITPAGLLAALDRRTCLFALERLSVWQRNAGLSARGERISTGWFGSTLGVRGPLADVLATRQIRVGTGWESNLLSGGQVSYWSCSPPSSRQMPIPDWTPNATR